MDPSERELAGYEGRRLKRLRKQKLKHGDDRPEMHRNPSTWVAGRKPGPFGRNLRAFRKMRKLSVPKLAALTQMTKSQVDGYECGQPKNIRMDNLIKLALALDVPVGVLYGIEPYREGEKYGRPLSDGTVDLGKLAGAGGDVSDCWVVLAQRSRGERGYFGGVRRPGNA